MWGGRSSNAHGFNLSSCRSQGSTHFPVEQHDGRPHAGEGLRQLRIQVVREREHERIHAAPDQHLHGRHVVLRVSPPRRGQEHRHPGRGELPVQLLRDASEDADDRHQHPYQPDAAGAQSARRMVDLEAERLDGRHHASACLVRDPRRAVEHARRVALDTPAAAAGSMMVGARAGPRAIGARPSPEPVGARTLDVPTGIAEEDGAHAIGACPCPLGRARGRRGIAGPDRERGRGAVARRRAPGDRVAPAERRQPLLVCAARLGPGGRQRPRFDFRAVSGNGDPPSQAATLTQLVDQGVRAIMLNSIDPTATVPGIAYANEKGVPAVNLYGIEPTATAT